MTGDAYSDDRGDEAAQRQRILEIAQAAIVAITTGAAQSPSTIAANAIEALDEIVSASLPESMRRTTLGQSAQRVLQRVERIRAGKGRPSAALGNVAEGTA